MNTVTIADWRPESAASLRDLLRDPSLTSDFGDFQDPGGVGRIVQDPCWDGDLTKLALIDAEPVGFVFTCVPPTPGGCFAALRGHEENPCRLRAAIPSCCDPLIRSRGACHATLLREPQHSVSRPSPRQGIPSQPLRL